MNLVLRVDAEVPRGGVDGPARRVQAACESLRSGGGVIIVDDVDRENEGDFVFSTDHLTERQMALMIREGSGIVCLVLEAAAAERLDLAPMVENNTSANGTAFTVSIEAAVGVTTGVSARDRVATIRAATRAGASSADIVRPGHVFPLRAHPDGIAARRGHTEATVEILCRAGLSRSGVLCEIMNPDGTMARRGDIRAIAAREGLAVLSIADLAATLYPKLPAEFPASDAHDVAA